ncbi:MAG: hypothetical protein AMXMBFR44_4550 [Candidatus Campbellbacteria bacterium]
MDILSAFKEGKVDGENSTPEHIVTGISNIFVFETKAYKLYKSDSQFFNENFNDLSKKENRFSFTRKDFEWNNRLSPEIYTQLKGVVVSDGRVKFVDPTDSVEELVIVMNKIDMSDQVIRKLVDNQLSLNDCYEIGKQFGERSLKLPPASVNITAYKDFLTRHHDEAAWIKSVKEVPEDEADKYLTFVKDCIEKYREILESSNQIGLCLDVHADNAIYTNGTFLPIDTYAPKEAWLYGFKNINIYRIATDFYVFLGEEAFNEVIRGYEDATGQKLPRDWDTFMVVYCEIIMWPYQYMLAEKQPWRKDIAEKHHTFLRSLVLK